MISFQELGLVTVTGMAVGANIGLMIMHFIICVFSWIPHKLERRIYRTSVFMMMANVGFVMYAITVL